MKTKSPHKLLLCLLTHSSLVLSCLAQPGPSLHHASAAHVILPHVRPTTAAAAQVSRVDVTIEILEQAATTTIDFTLTNPSNARLEAEMLIPVPNGVVLRGFDFQGAGTEPSAALLPKEEAKRIYTDIVAKTRDPALLEFVGYGLIRSAVFPVAPRGGQKVRVIYEQILNADGDRVDYLLPRSESIDYHVPWNIVAQLRSKARIATVYSPSHKLEIARLNPQHMQVRVAAEAATDPGPFRLSWLREREGMTASLLAYPDPKIGGGYFLLLAAAPLKAPEAKAVKRELILVLDRSGSMAGEKLEQVRAAALQVLEGLDDGEAFNIIVYHEAVESFAATPVIKDAETMRAARAYLRRLHVRGGTNIHDALLEALRSRPREGFLPIVLFLTDGLPTVGQTSETAIRKVATEANPHERRIFTFGVGVDVNTPLLDRIASETRAAATFVLPKEDVEVKVGQVFRRLAGPVLAAPKLHTADGEVFAADGRVHELMPSRLPDLFEGDQLVVLGQYVGDAPLSFTLGGDYFGHKRTFKFKFPVTTASTRNAFVPRLWASRKIALLTDAIRDLGAEGELQTAQPTTTTSHARELVTEIVALSKEFGILTEYTAFLAREGTDLTQPQKVLTEAWENFQSRAMQTRSGYASVNQDLNNSSQRVQSCVNPRNHYLDTNLNQVALSTVQQVNDRAFYRRGDRWIDSRLIDQSQNTPERIVSFGSEEFRQLAFRLSEQNRQGCMSLRGEILLQVDGQSVLIR